MTEIRFSSQEMENGLVLTCEDDGTGIRVEDKARLFQKGFGKNTGLGLFLSREILAITGITISETGCRRHQDRVVRDIRPNTDGQQRSCGFRSCGAGRRRGSTSPHQG